MKQLGNKKFTETTSCTFSILCLTHEKFIIPTFQRNLAWKNKNINDLWESMINNDKEYFIGNLVFLSPTEDSDQRYIVIDGQQRLFTISLILMAVRNEYNNIDVKNKEMSVRKRGSVENINNLLFYRENIWPFEKSSRILPGKDNLKEIYEKLLEDKIDVDNNTEIEKLDDNQLKYIRNYKTIRRLVRKHLKDEKNKFDKLDELFEKVASLLFIIIVCNSDNDAYQIFEGLNATGVGLSVADLVKNAVMQRVKGQETKTVIEEIWEQLEKYFEDIRATAIFPKFLRHQWISREGYVTNSQLFDYIKKDKLKSEKKEEIIKYVKELLSDAEIYLSCRFEKCESILLKKSNKISQKTLFEISKFRYLDIDQAYELILAFCNKFISSSSYTEKQLINDLNRLWIFCFRAGIISINPSEYEKRFADHCKTINSFNGKKFDEMSITFFKDIKKLVDHDQEFIENFVEEVKYNSSYDLCLYILEALMKKDNSDIKVSDPTIEHILPKEPSKWNLSKNDIKDFVNDIGNLTVLCEGDNKSLGNETMKVKIDKVFSKSHFNLNQELTKKLEGFIRNPKLAIRKRGEEIAVKINKIFKI